METMVSDTIGRVLVRVDHNMIRGSIKHMGDTDVLQVSDVTDSLAVADDDAVVHLVTVNT